MSVGNRYKADEFAVAVLEKVAKLEDEEEVAGLVGDAQGRRDFDFPPSDAKVSFDNIMIADVLKILFLLLRLCGLFEKS